MKKFWSVIAAGALISSVFSPGASAQTASEIPATVNIEDPSGDSNGLNNQGLPVPAGGDMPGGVNFIAGDFLQVWFTSTADDLNVHIRTSAPGGGGNWAMIYRVFVNDDCTALQGTFGGKSNADAAPTASIRDFCGDLENVPGEIVIEALEDGTGLTTLTFPLGAWPGIEDGATLAAPNATSRIVSPAASAPQMDTTIVGTDYTISGGGTPTAPPVKEEPPVKNGCKKGKGKKKGCDKGKGPKGPKPGACPAITPMEGAEEAPTTVVTDSATAEAPLEFVINTELGTPEAPTTVFQNIQVDSAAKDAGLYVRYEFGTDEDMDLYLQNSDGSTAAQAAGFNPAPVVPGQTDGTGTGGHSEQGAEQVDGALTSDCGGYTAQFDAFLGYGGERTVKVWLGDATWDPAAQAPVPAKALVF